MSVYCFLYGEGSTHYKVVSCGLDAGLLSKDAQNQALIVSSNINRGCKAIIVSKKLCNCCRVL